MKPYTPSELIEQINFVEWLDLKGYKYTAIPNSTYTQSWNQKRKNRQMGLRAGFPDLVVIAADKFMCIEMKRRTQSVVTPSQKDWIEALQNAGVHVKVCYGCDEAIAFVKAVVGLT